MFLAALAAAGCAGPRQTDRKSPPLVVFAAASLARPLKAALDSFAVARGASYELESAGSLELARRVTELGRIPDVIAVADEEVFEQVLVPSHVTWYARFARNRMVVARSTRLAHLTTDNWWRALTAPGVEVGRPDPDLDPAGYRTLFVFQLAARHYGIAALDALLLDSSPRRNMRPKSADLVALLQASELDAAFMYESSARAARLPFAYLPPAIDLGSDSLAGAYALASMRVPGTSAGDTITVRGAPIRYGISIPLHSAQPELAAAFLEYLIGPDGNRTLRAEFLDAVAAPQVRGTDAPSWLAR
jgi:molybdate/tungstate transport system substrate-binding protein